MNKKVMLIIIICLTLGTVGLFIYKGYFYRGDARSLMNHGIESVKGKDYDEAVDYFSRAIKLSDKADDLFYNRGVAYLYLFKYRLAIQDFTSAIELNPENKLAFVNRGLAFLKNGERDKALMDYQEALRLGHKGAEKMVKELSK